jgi:N-acetylglutamate synthase-like GNAT family acetyltransferase
MDLLIQIREYHPNDHDQLIQLMKLNIPHYFDDSELSEFSFYLKEEIEDYFVVEADAKIVGCGGINYEAEQYRAVISWDMIHPSFQGKGIGKALLDHRIARVKSQAHLTELLVRTSQHTWVFYRKSGFELMFVKKDFWAKDIDLYQMVMKLK